jgi:hypothetical protein
MRFIKCDDVIHVPSESATCPKCMSDLFAVIATYLPDTGEAIGAGIYVGCTNCDAEIDPPVMVGVREWVYANYRVKV